MATIAHQELDEHSTGRPAVTGVTVHGVHQQVCTARLRHREHGRTHPARGESRRHRQVSEYRATSHPRVTADAPNVVRCNDSQRRATLTVLTVTFAVGLLYLWVARVVEPDITDTLLLFGIFLITVAGAVVLNAITVESMNPPAREPRPPAPPRRR